ncbi:MULTISPECIES: hypothetical protein [unclassified Microbacterium]|uniref:hypothetical protein n=1 Tax=unclassified Microbacterium TaxID=2609290 RepID=UPI003651AD30
MSRRTLVTGSVWSIPVVVAATAFPAAAASPNPQPCPTFDACGLYGSSGSVIFRYAGDPATTGPGFTVQENSGQFAGSYWSSNLAIGPYVSAACPTPTYVFYGSRYSNSFLNIYRARAAGTGLDPIVEIVGPIPSGPTWAAWGGMACDPLGNLWMISNLTALSTTQIARVNPQNASTLTSTFALSGVGLVAGGANAAVAASGTIIPDITFTGDGRMYGLIYSTAAGSSGQVWLCEYLTDTLTAGGRMTISPIRQITGPAASASTSIYGFAWLGSAINAESGLFYAVHGGTGQLYAIDPNTGISATAGTKTSPATYDYAVTDLASAPVGGCSI